MSVRELFASAKRPEVFFWAVLLAALMLHLLPGSRQFFAMTIAGAGADPRLTPELSWHSILWHHGATFLVFLLPLLLMRRLGIHDGGLSLFSPGDWRWGLKWTLIGCVLATGPAWIQAGDPAWLKEYPLSMPAFDSAGMLALFLASYLLYYIGWEAFFRGYIGFGMTGLGYTPFLALMVQVVVSTLVHIGKPDAELLGAIPFAILMGIVAWRSRSLLWPLLIHFWLGTVNTLFCWMQHPAA